MNFAWIKIREQENYKSANTETSSSSFYTHLQLIFSALFFFQIKTMVTRNTFNHRLYISTFNFRQFPHNRRKIFKTPILYAHCLALFTFTTSRSNKFFPTFSFFSFFLIFDFLFSLQLIKIEPHVLWRWQCIIWNSNISSLEFASNWNIFIIIGKISFLEVWWIQNCKSKKAVEMVVLIANSYEKFQRITIRLSLWYCRSCAILVSPKSLVFRIKNYIFVGRRK